MPPDSVALDLSGSIHGTGNAIPEEFKAPLGFGQKIIYAEQIPSVMAVVN